MNYTRTLAVVVLLVALVGILGPSTAPVSVSYVESGSMQPTLHPGDGYLLVPAGDVETGDVVTFYAPTRGTYVTHRVVGHAEGGFRTKGDANPTSDQAGGLPPVERSQVVGEVASVGGPPLVVPGLGHLVEAVRSNLAVALVAAAGAVLVATAAEGNRRRGRDRELLRIRTVWYPLVAVALAVAVGVVLTSAVHATIPYAVQSGGGETARTLPSGEAAVRTHHVRLVRAAVTTVVVDADGGRVVDSVRTSREIDGPLVRRSSFDVDVRIPPQDAGTHRTTVNVYAYPATLPKSVLAALGDVSPLAAATASVSALFAPVLALYHLFVDGREPIRPPRSHAVRRWLGGEP